MQPALLTLNAGSSSLKFSLFLIENHNNLKKIFYGHVEESLDKKITFLVKNEKSEPIFRKIEIKNSEILHEFGLKILLKYLKEKKSNYTICVAGHRVVHGGESFMLPTVMRSKEIAKLKDLSVLAPLHQPYNIKGIEVLSELMPNIFQVACFDTAFHTTQSEIEQAYALPEGLAKIPIKRYGFHGLSYEYITQMIPYYLGDDKSAGKIIIAHLGYGSSMCAIRNRKSVATTMGFTALDGLPMGTRCGNIDPGVILYLLQTGMTTEEVTKLLYKQSGLKGISKISGDMRILLSSNQALAKKAIEIFVYRMKRELGSLVAALDGLDSLIFTAGIGENSPEIRSRFCEGISWLPLVLNAKSNQKNQLKISKKGNKVSIWVIPTNEELIIAQHALALWNASHRNDVVCKI